MIRRHPTSTGLDRRFREAEIMDDPDLEADRHVAALEGLSRLNSLSRSVRIVWGPIRATMHRLGVNSLRVLDLASGAGDIPIGLWRRARRAGLDLEIHGVDSSGRAVDYARDAARAAGVPVEFHHLDVLADPLPVDFDVITSSLFLHHLDDDQAEKLLAVMRDAARHGIVINDLLRSTGGLWLTRFAVRAFTSSDVVRIDGVRSVKAAFTEAEMRALADRAGMPGSVLRRRWPFRFVLTWDRE